jgi:hypothetical protein
MKLLKLLPLNYTSITNFLTSIANQKVPGLKTKTTTLLDAIAQNEGLSKEALKTELNNLHKNAYTVNTLYVKLECINGIDRVISTSLNIQVSGTSRADNISCYNGVLDDTGTMTDCIFEINYSSPIPLEGFSANNTMRNTQLALGFAGDFCAYINANKSNISRSKLSKMGADIIDVNFNSSKGTAENTINIQNTNDNDILWLIKNSNTINALIKEFSKETPNELWTIIDIHEAVLHALDIDLNIEITPLFNKLLEHFNKQSVQDSELVTQEDKEELMDSFSDAIKPKV